MENQIVQEWKKLKNELTDNINILLDKDDENRDIFGMMLNMLENSKIKQEKGTK